MLRDGRYSITSHGSPTVERDVVHGDRVAGELPRSSPHVKARLRALSAESPEQALGGQHLLDRDVAVEELVTREPHGAHAAAAYSRSQPISACHQVLRTRCDSCRRNRHTGMIAA